jgi:hypothetical protein
MFPEPLVSNEMSALRLGSSDLPSAEDRHCIWAFSDTFLAKSD